MAVSLYRDGNFKEAFKIAKTFKRSLKGKDMDNIVICYEMMTGKEVFYSQIGYRYDNIFKLAVVSFEKCVIGK